MPIHRPLDTRILLLALLASAAEAQPTATKELTKGSPAAKPGTTASNQDSASKPVTVQSKTGQYYTLLGARKTLVKPNPFFTDQPPKGYWTVSLTVKTDHPSAACGSLRDASNQWSVEQIGFQMVFGKDGKIVNGVHACNYYVPPDKKQLLLQTDPFPAISLPF